MGWTSALKDLLLLLIIIMNKMSSSNDPEDPWCDPANPRVLDFEQVSAAAYKIRDGIVRTPCDVSILATALGGVRRWRQA